MERKSSFQDKKYTKICIRNEEDDNNAVFILKGTQ